MSRNEELINKAKEYLARESHPGFRKEVEDLLAEEKYEELQDRFYRILEFGTGGLRGVIGGGLNRMNSFVVRRATQGLANYIKKQYAGRTDLCAVIAYDSRRYSDLFALDAALVFAGNGIKTYVFSSLRPTPELSFAIQHLKAVTGIVVTASHNPPEYNGYKAYWNDGGQITSPHDSAIIQDVLAVDTINSLGKQQAVDQGKLEFIDELVDKPYMKMTRAQLLRPALFAERAKNLTVVYTPLHGTGAVLLEPVLRDLGVNLVPVAEQWKPDGSFPTVAFPNPEEASAMELALAWGKKSKADIIIGTDPDSDRIGIAVPEGAGFRLLSGNQLGALLADYIFLTRKELSLMPKKPAFIKTIVTTEMQRAIADYYGVETFDVLTGFKFIAEQIKKFETEKTGHQFIFGGEESYGFLTSDEVRDKDAIAATLMTVEMTLYWQSIGKSVLDRLNDLYFQYGYYQESLISSYFKGEKGLSVMNQMMADLRANCPAEIAGIAVKAVFDYLALKSWNLATPGKTATIDLPKSNVLQFHLVDGTVVSARPSGTEPKIKFYVSSHTGKGLSAEEGNRQVAQKISALESAIKSIITRYNA